MLDLNLPPFDINVKKTAGKLTVFDRLRRKFIALTPEEWVRQHFVNYLIVNKGYSASLIANEIQINLHNQKRRCDTVIYDKGLSPIMIVEYKAPEVNITQDVFDQIVRYNIVLRVKYLVVSNGLNHYCCKLNYETQSFEYLSDIPSYNDL
ncbi:type I restriction enzyme HsdR N-terminal domain-containing protein [Dysgonomonas sp. BGC7]|uniref:type I restriction enzyme HsdR N-terminal domain-containing protein n=1 Tax=Dysgonomonas sp. BGC7 TaxID=1658008 RepID=UPI000683783E|nr:type I restriction enzyme HsdR N-terminal domain-containing protein [Dysgonomonas sp. BGC7]MBD8389808.1 type I restriction enzyme HsdR N-terminal domain-containing protein [Dysgonomonas sp. BGC7]